MLVVDDANVGQLQLLNDRDLVLGFAEPAAVVVEGDLATNLRRRFGNRANAARLGDDTRPLIGLVLRWSSAAGDPQLRSHLVLLEHGERQLGFVIERRRDPPRRQFDLVPLEAFNLLIERRDVFGAVVVSKLREAQLGEHRRPLLRPALLRVKRHDAPCDEVRSREEIGRGRFGGGQRPRAAQCHSQTGDSQQQTVGHRVGLRKEGWFIRLIRAERSCFQPGGRQVVAHGVSFEVTLFEPNSEPSPVACRPAPADLASVERLIGNERGQSQAPPRPARRGPEPHVVVVSSCQSSLPPTRGRWGAFQESKQRNFKMRERGRMSLDARPRSRCGLVLFLGQFSGCPAVGHPSSNPFLSAGDHMDSDWPMDGSRGFW